MMALAQPPSLDLTFDGKPFPPCAKPTDRLRVIYQGGSIAALASASLLADAGYDVILFEMDKDNLELGDDGAMDYSGGRVRCSLMHCDRANVWIMSLHVQPSFWSNLSKPWLRFHFIRIALWLCVFAVEVSHAPYRLYLCSAVQCPYTSTCTGLP